ncbi:MAG TPA: hypothetical protein VD996_09065 [Chitinophagaceae bacterium]|nr:hypothetical protein [Chitinophagaceae bacterium]
MENGQFHFSACFPCAGGVPGRIPVLKKEKFFQRLMLAAALDGHYYSNPVDNRHHPLY